MRRLCLNRDNWNLRGNPSSYEMESMKQIERAFNLNQKTLVGVSRNFRRWEFIW
jgi:hypothetical protein